MAKDDLKPQSPGGATEFVFLSLIDNDQFDSLGTTAALKADDRPYGARVDSIRKVTGGFEIAYTSATPKNRTDPAAGKTKKDIVRFVPFSFVKSAIAKGE